VTYLIDYSSTLGVLQNSKVDFKVLYFSNFLFYVGQNFCFRVFVVFVFTNNCILTATCYLNIGYFSTISGRYIECKN